jgi:DNA-binding NtrC family response regulator
MRIYVLVGCFSKKVLLGNLSMPEEKSEQILIVDDEPLIRDFLCEALSWKGYKVISVNNGHEALDILKRNVISAVITDVQMPKMSGTDLLQKIKHISPDIPVVVITAYGTVSGAVETMKYGASDYLPSRINLRDGVGKLYLV